MADGPDFIPPAFGALRVRRAHPFRRTLPDRVLRLLPEYEPEVKAAMNRAANRAANRAECALIADEAVAGGAREQAAPLLSSSRWLRFTAQDARDFALTYLACLTGVATFIF